MNGVKRMDKKGWINLCQSVGALLLKCLKRSSSPDLFGVLSLFWAKVGVGVLGLRVGDGFRVAPAWP